MVRPYRVSPGAMSSANGSYIATAPATIVIAGPTASGKSALALRIAEEFGGVVINADSMQVYDELSILTARPGAEDEARVPHRLYGALSAAEVCSVARWRDMALVEIEAAHAAGQLPVICGGSGLYLKALTDGLAKVPEIPADIRQQARTLHLEIGGEAMHARLAEHDPEMAGRLAPGNTQRLIRAWEVLQATGRSLSDWQAQSQDASPTVQAFTITLMPERALLYAACDARFDAMLAAGALEEVRRLAALGLDPALPAMKALGVPQLLAVERGQMLLEEATEIAKRETRRYAKRQMTWFRHQISSNLTLETQYSESLWPKIFSKIRPYVLTAPD
ncbi:MAG: tRNA (adenosine(37)-N6)-dimethylallyltransferase MiaA [Rhodospirillaceae bacterium]|nr:tRNA (adenosine(37)-N6)-dimethylallyltransferase MiaA [Rhodospirillaceae bacterium]